MNKVDGSAGLALDLEHGTDRTLFGKTCTDEWCPAHRRVVEQLLSLCILYEMVSLCMDESDAAGSAHSPHYLCRCLQRDHD